MCSRRWLRADHPLLEAALGAPGRPVSPIRSGNLRKTCVVYLLMTGDVVGIGGRKECDGCREGRFPLCSCWRWPAAPYRQGPLCPRRRRPPCCTLTSQPSSASTASSAATRPRVAPGWRTTVRARRRSGRATSRSSSHRSGSSKRAGSSRGVATSDQGFSSVAIPSVASRGARCTRQWPWPRSCRTGGRGRPGGRDQARGSSDHPARRPAVRSLVGPLAGAAVRPEAAGRSHAVTLPEGGVGDADGHRVDLAAELVSQPLAAVRTAGALLLVLRRRHSQRRVETGAFDLQANRRSVQNTSLR